MNELTKQETVELERLEKTIQAGKNTFVMVGIALTKIRDLRLYRRDFDTFENYCAKRWGWTRQRSHQLIDAADVVKQLPPDLSTAVDKERLARELGKVPKSKREKVLRKATEKAKGRKKPLGSKDIKEAAAVEVEAEVIVTDRMGYPVPDGMKAMFTRSQEIQDLLTGISRIRGRVEAGLKEDDPMFRHVNQAALSHLSRAYQHLSEAKPYAVCLYCQGVDQTREKCQPCRGTGFLSQFAYEQKSEDKLRNMRQKLIENQKKK